MGKKVTACAGMLLAGSLLTACGGGEEPKSELELIDEAITDAMNLENEIWKVKNRLIIDCMSDLEFDTHPLDLTQDPGEWMEDEEEYKPLVGSEPPDAYEIPTLKDAKEVGFDVGRYMDPDYNWEDEEGKEGGPESDPFYDEMTEKYREEYDKARYGEEYYEYMYSERPMEEGEGAEGGRESLTMGGCEGGVNESIYGPPKESENAEEEGEGVPWPEGMNDWEGQRELYETDELLDARDKWSTCVEGKGHPYFEFTEESLGMWEYVNSFYEDGGQMMMGDDGEEAEPRYEAPKGAPWPFEEAYEKEIALAVDVANCADETGLRKVMETEWDNAMEKTALDNQEEIFAWHDKLKDVLAKAQGLLQG